jgi:hypothetical protein
MFKRITDMPPGTAGFEAVGEIDDDDFEEVVAPVLLQQIADGTKFACCTCSGRGSANTRGTRHRRS